MEIRVDEASLRAFDARGRSQTFTLHGQVCRGDRATICGQIDGKEVSRTGKLIPAGKKTLHKWALHRTA